MKNNKVFGIFLGTIIAVIVIVTAGYYLFFQPVKESDIEKLTRTISSEEQQIMDKNIFTEEMLAQFNGKSGKNAYIAINGIVYDVSDRWKDGEHHSLVAGKNLTQEFLSSSHGHAIISKLEIVGQYIE
jgi:predicted heme/steroid binding protein